MGLHRRGVEQQFAAAAQRHAGRRGDDREGGVFHRLHRLLAVFQHALDHRPDADIGGEQGQAEIGADGEVGALVVEHKRPEVLFHKLQRFLKQRNDIGIQRIHPGMDLEAGDPVADIPQAGGAVARDRFGRPLDIFEQQHAFGPLDRAIDAVRAEDLQAVAGDPVECPVADPVEQRRHVPALAAQTLGDIGGAEPVGQFERAPFPGVAQAHRGIDVGDRIRDLRHERGAVADDAGEHAPGPLPAAVRMLGQGAQVPRPGPRALQLRPARRRIVPGRQIDRLLYPPPALAVEPVEAALALAAGVARLDHAPDEIVLAEIPDIGIVRRQAGDHAGGDLRHEIDADQVHQAEDAGPGHAHRPAADGVGLLDRQPQIHRAVDRGLDPVAADPVGDEARRVVARDHGFAEPDIAEPADGPDRFRVGARAGDGLQQAQIARRVEEMGDEEAGGERVVHPVEQFRQRDGRRVRCDRRAGFYE